MVYLILSVVAALLIWSFFGLTGIIEGAMDARRDAKVSAIKRRKALQLNIRELIEALLETDDPGLDRALQDSIIEYRLL